MGSQVPLQIVPSLDPSSSHEIAADPLSMISFVYFVWLWATEPKIPLIKSIRSPIHKHYQHPQGIFNVLGIIQLCYEGNGHFLPCISGFLSDAHIVIKLSTPQVLHITTWKVWDQVTWDNRII